MKFGMMELVIILLIVIVLFGTKKLRSIGSDLGGAVKSFRSSIKDEDKSKDEDGEKADEKIAFSEKHSESGNEPVDEKKKQESQG